MIRSHGAVYPMLPAGVQVVVVMELLRVEMARLRGAILIAPYEFSCYFILQCFTAVCKYNETWRVACKQMKIGVRTLGGPPISSH